MGQGGIIMTTNVIFNDEFVSEAKSCADAESRSVSEQIELWAKVGRTMIANPDLNYEFVSELMAADREVKQGLFTTYKRRTKSLTN